MTRSERYRHIHIDVKLDLLLKQLSEISDQLEHISNELLDKTAKTAFDEMLDNPMERLEELFKIPHVNQVDVYEQG